MYLWGENKGEYRMGQNYKLTICYDGTRYSGWERKKDRDTIQGKLEAVLNKLCGSPVVVNGAGRTDAGVHARGMVASVTMNVAMEPREIRDYMNRYLPDDIAVEEVREASERFHARYKAVGKLYCYTCYDGPSKPVFDRKYVTAIPFHPDLDKMRQAAAYLEGKHDFKSFCGNSRMKKSTVRTVDKIEIIRKGSYIYLNFHGDGFLQNMVRILTGTLLEVGRGKISPEQIPEILAACDRQKAGPTAPPGGLCLMKVDY